MLTRRALRPFRVGVRYNSTAEPVKKKSIRLEQFGDIRIPSAAEVNAKRNQPPPPPPKPKSYEADLSYLQDAPSSSLSAKLMRMEQPTPEEEAALAEKRQEDRVANMHAHLQKYRGVAENADLIRGEFNKSSAFLSGDRPTSLRNEPTGNQRGPRRGGNYRDSQRGEDGRQTRYVQQPRRVEGERPYRDGQQNTRYDRDRHPPQRREDDNRVRTDRQPRRLEGETPRRPQMENRQPHNDRRKQNPSSTERRGRPGARTSSIEKRPQPDKAQVAKTEMLLDPDLADLDERIFEGTYKPTLTSAPVVASDPRSLFGTTSFAQRGAVIAAQDGTQTVVASGTVDSFRGNKYDAYIKVAPEDFASPPDRIGPVKTALRTLAHQGHYSPPGTARTVGIITRITPKMAPAVPAP